MILAARNSRFLPDFNCCRNNFVSFHIKTFDIECTIIFRYKTSRVEGDYQRYNEVDTPRVDLKTY